MSSMSGFYKMFGGLVGKHTFDHIDIESPVNETTFKTKMNSFVTLIRLHGLYKIPGNDEFKEACKQYTDLLSTVFSNPGYTVQFVFDYDKKHTEEQAKENFVPIEATCQRLKVDFSDINREQIDIISQFCCYESCTIALWSHPSSLNSSLSEIELKRVQADSRKVVGLFSDVPNPFYMESLLNNHEAFVETFHAAVVNAGYSAEVMDCHDSAREIRLQIEQDVCSHTYRPILWGDKQVFTSIGEHETELNLKNVLVPRIDQQITTIPHVDIEPGIIQVGNTYYAPLYVDMFPGKMIGFQQFLSNMAAIGARFRISFTLNQGLGFVFGINNILNSIFRFAHSDNKYFREAADAHFDVGDDRVDLSLQIVMVLKSDKLETLRQHLASVPKRYQLISEGNLRLEAADPSQLHLTTAIGAKSMNSAVVGHPPVEAAVKMLPIMRSASFWRQGGVAFRTFSNSVWYWQPGSAQQESQMDMIIARPRMGKSVLSNCILKAFCLKAGITALPYCITFDIGKASFGFVELLRDSLPDELKYQTLTHTLLWSRDHSMNPMDIQLGLKYPLVNERNDIITFLMTLISEPGYRAKEGMVDCVSAIVDAAFEYYANPLTAKLYAPLLNADVDELLQSDPRFNELLKDDRLSWYELRDALFDAGYVNHAIYAQNMAVPLITDLPVISGESERLQTTYGKLSGMGVDLIQHFSNKIQAVIGDYPIFTESTKIKFAGARIIAIDLQPGCGDFSPLGFKKTALTVLGVRYQTTRHLYLRLDEHLKAFDNRYRSYQERRIREINDIEKRITYDEFHMYSAVESITDQVARDQRIAGKANMQICIITHLVRDLSESIIRNCTNRFILGSVQEADVKEISEKLGLSDTEKQILRGNYLHGPKKGGSSLLYMFDIKDGKYSQLLRFAIGPVELWSYSTTNQDRIIRTHLYERIGKVEARSWLAKKFPNGTAINEIERRMQARTNIQDLSENIEEVGNQMATVIANELLEDYFNTVRD